jgi:hypothetical protein
LYQWVSSGNASAIFTNPNKNRLPGTAGHSQACLGPGCRLSTVLCHFKRPQFCFVFFKCSKTLFIEHQVSLWSPCPRYSFTTWLNIFLKNLLRIKNIILEAGI